MKNLKPINPESAAYLGDEISFYKRPLSDKLVSFSSPEGMRLFKESMEAGYMHNYFPLAEQFTT